MNKKKLGEGPFFSYIDFGIFQGSVLLCVGANYKEITSFLRRKKHVRHLKAIADAENEDLINKSYALCLQRSLKDKSSGNFVDYYFIILREFNFNNDYHITTLSHEIVHLCQLALDRILDRKTELEAEAYFHQYIFNKALSLLRTRKKKS